MDATYARGLYERYQEHFLINRLGIAMFREYPESAAGSAGIDSGPVIWGAGVTATGVGLAASLSNGDFRTAEDIHALAAALGLKYNITHDDRHGSQYLFGLVPVGDAFLTWAHTLPVPDSPLSSPRSFGARLIARTPIVVVFLVYSLIVVVALRRLIRRGRARQEQKSRGREGAGAETTEAVSG